MSMKPEQNTMTMLSKLTGMTYYINWRHRIEAYVQQRDLNLLGLTEQINEATNAKLRRLFTKSVIAKSTITLTLADDLLTKASSLIDSDKNSLQSLDRALHLSKFKYTNGDKL